jgi:spoIIIJ-associated protein
MATESYEFTGKSVEDAVAEGLKTLKLRAEEVSVEVIQKGSRGIFGLGSEPAQVRLVVQSTQAPLTPSPLTQSSLPTTPPVVADATEQLPTAPVQPRPVTAANTQPNVQANPVQANPVQGESTPEVSSEISDDELVDLAVDLLGKTVVLMGFSAAVESSWREEEVDEEDYRKNDHKHDHGDSSSHYLYLNVCSSGGDDDLNALIGHQGSVLDALQYLVRLMVNQRLRRWKNIVVDVDSYKEHRVTQLKQIALRMADQVASSGRAMALEPMPSNERRIIHMTLRDHPRVFTESTGEGDRRKINIVARLD